MRLYTQQKSACGHPAAGAFLCTLGASGICNGNRTQRIMYAPRRHSRRLLLPPGWVALGFLLLLGCQVLLAHRRQVRQERVIRLLTPMWKQDTTGLSAHRRDKLPFLDFSYAGHRSKAELDTAIHWCNFSLTGVRSADSTTAQRIFATIKTMQVDTLHARGIRVRFHRNAAYANLVQILDMMNEANQKVFWFDIQQRPAVFYILTRKHSPYAERRQREEIKDFYI